MKDLTYQLTILALVSVMSMEFFIFSRHYEALEAKVELVIHECEVGQ